MIEVPRARDTGMKWPRPAVRQLRHTKTTYADDVRLFTRRRPELLPEYVKKEILERDPFQSLRHRAGVGKLVRMAVQLGSQTQPDLK